VGASFSALGKMEQALKKESAEMYKRLRGVSGHVGNFHALKTLL